MKENTADYKLNTPVAFIIFNRPDTTARVLSTIAAARPPKLLVIADGPRGDRPGEDERCAQTRALIGRVDWDCEVLTNYADHNLGCRTRVSSGLDWVFDSVSEAIILEDDCLPDPAFFRFCEELLERYREDSRVGMIGGSNFQHGVRQGSASYYFSHFFHIWGWASWRRAWHSYDAEMRDWPAARDGRWLAELLGSRLHASRWRDIFDRVASGGIDTWDYQWTFANWFNNRLAVIPEVNLVTNIGFGADATHTVRPSRYANMPAAGMEFPLQHPGIVLPNRQADLHYQRQSVSLPMLLLERGAALLRHR